MESVLGQLVFTVIFLLLVMYVTALVTRKPYVRDLYHASSVLVVYAVAMGLITAFSASTTMRDWLIFMIAGTIDLFIYLGIQNTLTKRRERKSQPNETDISS